MFVSHRSLESESRNLALEVDSEKEEQLIKEQHKASEEQQLKVFYL